MGWVVQTTAQITGLTPTVTLSSISGHAYAPDLGQDVPLPNYDANGNRLGLKVSIGSTDDFSNTYTYDNLGRLTSVTQSGQGGNAVAPKRVDFTYDADNQDATITQYADLAGTQQVATGAYTYDHAGRLTGLTYTQPNSTGLPSYGWSYDAAGQVTQMVMPDGTVNYTNDGTGQLTAATSTGDPNLNESHSYDSNGNRTDTGCSTGTNNRLLSDGTFTYTYDNEGNRISRTRISSDPADDYQTLYTWDNRDRLTSVTFKDNNGDTTKTVTYLYDVFDRWIGETIAVPGQAVQQTRFVYDGNQIVLQFDKTGTGDLAASDLSHRYLWGPAVDQLLADEALSPLPPGEGQGEGFDLSTAGSVVWPLADHEGTIRDLAVYNSGTDVTTIANHRVYDGFGVLKSQTNAAVDCLFGYTGRAFDKAAGEQYNGERWYEAVTGRWLSEDPAGFAAGDANLNRYVGNSPLNFRDPWGLDGGATATSTMVGMNMLGTNGGAGGPSGASGGAGGVSVGCGCGGYAVLVAYDSEDIDGMGPSEHDPDIYLIPLCAEGCGGSYAQDTGPSIQADTRSFWQRTSDWLSNLWNVSPSNSSGDVNVPDQWDNSFEGGLRHLLHPDLAGIQRPRNGTINIGLGVNGMFGPVGLNGSGGFVIDSSGNLAWYNTYGGGLGAGAKCSGGVAVGSSNAVTVYDLEGLFGQVTVGGGPGVCASMDTYTGDSPDGQILGTELNIGFGLGGGGLSGGTYTTLTPIVKLW